MPIGKTNLTTLAAIHFHYPVGATSKHWQPRQCLIERCVKEPPFDMGGAGVDCGSYGAKRTKTWLLANTAVSNAEPKS